MGNIKGKITIDELTPELKKEIKDANLSISNLQNNIKELKKSQQENFQSVSNGKSIMASAITDKGVKTLATDKFDVMASNVRKIKTGYNTGDKLTLDKFNVEYSYDNIITLCEQMHITNSTKSAYYTELDKGVILCNKDCSKIFFEFDDDNDKYTCYLYDLQNKSLIKKYSDISSSIGSTSYTFMQYHKDKDCFFYATQEEEKHDFGLKCIKTTNGMTYTLCAVQERPSIILDKNYLYAYLNYLNKTDVIYYKFNYDGTEIWKKEKTGPQTSNAFCYNGYLFVFSEWYKYIEKRNIETFDLISKTEYNFNINNYRLINNYLYIFNNKQIYIINLDSMNIERTLTLPSEIRNIHVYNEYLFVLLSNKTIIKYKNNIQILSYNKTSFYKDAAILGTEHDIYILYIGEKSLYVNHYEEKKSVKSISLK